MSSWRRHISLACLLAVTIAFGHSALARGGPEPELLLQARLWVDAFEGVLPTILANEIYTQHLVLPRRDERRLLRSEVGTVTLPMTEGLVFVRNVTDVDGRAVIDARGRLDALLNQSSPNVRARVLAIRDEGARFNLGTIHRNLNDPTFALRLLNTGLSDRLAFQPKGNTRLNDRETQRFDFRETTKPTLIRSGRDDVPLSGSVWIDANGVVVRTLLNASFVSPADVASNPTNVRTVATVSVDFVPEARLGLAAVPLRMHEEYRNIVESFSSSGSQARSETSELIECDARYEGYRKFETSIRVLP